MKITEAIERAVEGGYEPKYIRQYQIFERPETGKQTYELTGIFLDPAFWQCLSKSLGWDDEDPAMLVSGTWKKSYSSEPDAEDTLENYKENNEAPMWLYHWHAMIDHLASGGSVEEWFGKLK